MKMIVFVSAAILAIASQNASAQPAPGGNPNCTTNWVGGACGNTVDYGENTMVITPFCDREENFGSKECRKCGDKANKV